MNRPADRRPTRRSGRWGGRGWILALLAATSPAFAADRASDKVKDLDGDAVALQEQVEELRLNFTERSGLIGASEARERYEDAVYLFLVGDYATAATSFYILVQSNALGNADLARDSEWYLAECLYEMGNRRTAQEAYGNIVDKGETHPYFPDAVRRSMEVFSESADWASFDSYYTLYVVSGRVPATDVINYSLGKSFYRRGEYPRSVSMLEQVPAGSPYYGRARYLAGVVHIVDQKLPAAREEFRKVIAEPATNEAQKQVADLARMALARVSYEIGDFPTAQAAYAQIPKESPLYADDLYESVWTFIKQEKWNEALAQVDMFLAAFPQHQHTASMKTLQGHLHMKVEAYDNARAAYEQVVESYSPVVETLNQLEGNPLSLRSFLDDLSNPSDSDSTVIPGYATELLRGRDDVRRAVETWSTLRAQKEELGEAEHMVEDLQVALAGHGDLLGNFVAARNELAGIRGGALALRSRLLETEGNWLKSRIPSSYRVELADIQKRRTTVFEALSGEAGDESARTDKVQLYDEQIHEVQQRAFRLSQVAQEAQALGRSAREMLDAGQSRLPAAEASSVRAQVEQEEGVLTNLGADLDRVQSEVTRRRLLRSVESGPAGDDNDSHRAAIAQFEELRRALAGYRRHATDADAAATFARFDRLWQLADAVERSAEETSRVLSVAEAREIGAVTTRLAQQVERVAGLRSEIETSSVDTEALALRVLGGGLGKVRGQFEEDILLADKGIVDVYWLRKTGTTDAIAALNSERARLMRELDEQFRIVRENLDK